MTVAFKTPVDTVLTAIAPVQDAGAADRFEWPTFGLLAGCYLGWALATTWIASLSLWLAIPLTGVLAALHSSLQHEALHGHPFRSKALNAALVFPALTLFIPYLRFRDTHLDHHRDPLLTDPYDDPETNYMDPAVWQTLPHWHRAVLGFNNTLLGRMLIGTAISQVTFMAGDWRAIRAGDARVLRGWLWHVPAVALVILWLGQVAMMPVWAYLIAAYIGLSLLKIRTFLEHRAHPEVPNRTVIIEDRGPLALLFLNNNLHAVHHERPGVAWYRLPQVYAANRAAFVERNGAYVYRSYAQVFRQYLFRAKDPVAHPFWR